MCVCVVCVVVPSVLDASLRISVYVCGRTSALVPLDLFWSVENLEVAQPSREAVLRHARKDICMCTLIIHNSRETGLV